MNGYGDINKNIQNEIVNHEINGKSSNYYEATSPKTFLPNFKETIIDNSNNNQTSINNMDTKNVISMVDSPKCLTKKGLKHYLSHINHIKFFIVIYRLY